MRKAFERICVYRHISTARKMQGALCAALILTLSGCDDGSVARLYRNNDLLVVTKTADLAMAYADSSINVSVFRQQAILRLPNGNHIAAYYDADGYARLDVVDADLRMTNSFRVFPKLTDALLGDGHCVISLGRSDDGLIHVIFDAHATKPFYAQISIANIIQSNPPLTAIYASEWPDSLTYPQFYRVGGNLQLWYRSDNDETINRRIYVAGAGWFQKSADTILAPGATVSVYMNQLGVQGQNIALSWVYRMVTDQDDIVRNEGLFFAKSADSGKSWSLATGEAMKESPIYGDVDALFPIASSRQPINQTSSFLIPDGTSYISYYAKDSGGAHQIYLLTLSPKGDILSNEQVSDNTQVYDLLGRGTLELPLSRPAVAVSEHEVHLVYRQDNKIVLASRMLIPLFGKTKAWQYNRLDVGDIGAWEPSYDLDSWNLDHKLLLYVQFARQGLLDTNNHGQPSQARLFEIAEAR